MPIAYNTKSDAQSKVIIWLTPFTDTLPKGSFDFCWPYENRHGAKKELSAHHFNMVKLISVIMYILIRWVLLYVYLLNTEMPADPMGVNIRSLVSDLQTYTELHHVCFESFDCPTGSSLFPFFSPPHSCLGRQRGARTTHNTGRTTLLCTETKTGIIILWMSSPMCIVYKRLYHQPAKAAAAPDPQLLHCLSLFIGSIRHYMVGCKERNCTSRPVPTDLFFLFLFNYDH